MADAAGSVPTPAAGAWRLLPALGAAAATLWFAGFVPEVAHGGAPAWSVPWVPALGIDFAFRLDGLALAFALLICGIGALVFLYAATYFRTDRRLGSLLLTLIAFAVSMLGLVTADDAITLFVFWEGTTITSWLLVGFDHERASARAAALQALLVTALGGLALLAGLLHHGQPRRHLPPVRDERHARDVPRQPALPGDLLAGHPRRLHQVGAVAVPVLAAERHGGAHAGLGLPALRHHGEGRRLPPRPPDPGARPAPSSGPSVLVPVGGFTMLLASVWALRQTDLKLMLAYTTVMALSLMVMLLGVGTPAAIVAAMTFLIIHALYKAGLFLAVGMIEKGAGARDYPAVAGLARAMPLTAAVVALAALSMAGFPPLFGFVGKELIYDGHRPRPALAGARHRRRPPRQRADGRLRRHGGAAPVLPPARSSAPRTAPPTPAGASGSARSLLAALGLVCGLLPAAGRRGPGRARWPPPSPPPPRRPTSPSGTASARRSPSASSPSPSASSSTSLLDRIRDGLAAAEPRLPRTEGWYDAALAGLAAFALGLTSRVQNGRMTSYLRHTFLVFAALIWGAILLGSAQPGRPSPSALELIDWAIIGIIAASIVVVLRTHSRLTAITALGGVGSGIAIVFVLYGAIDVAMTQLFVEILVVVFLAIAMVRLPPSGAVPFNAGNALLAAVLGVGVTVALLSVLGTELDPYLTAYFEARSYPEAHGHNIVNVILVDFRGFDTLGEISVIVIAGVAVARACSAAGRKARR